MRPKIAPQMRPMRAPSSGPGCVSAVERNNDVALFRGTETPQLSPPLGPPLKAPQEIPLTIWCIDQIIAPWFPWSSLGQW